MTTIRSCVVGGLVVAMGIAGIAVAKAGCTLGCRYFHVAIGETVINGIQGNYCLVFPNNDRGGEVFGTDPSTLVNDILHGSKYEKCDAYDEHDCWTQCSRINVPYEADEPHNGNTVGDRSVWRYFCIEDSAE